MMTATKYGRLLVVAGGLAFLGCDAPPARGLRPTTQPTLRSSASPAPFGGRSAIPPAPKEIYMIHLQLGSVEVPVGVASGSEELWSYLDEEPVSLRSRVLGRNGIRVGLGRTEDWSDIERVLKNMTGQSFTTITMQTLPGRPTSVDLKSHQPVQTIFLTHEDGTLSGQQYPPGDNLLTFSCTLDENDPSDVLVTAVPQLRTTKRWPQFTQRGGLPTLTAQPKFFTFTPMTFQLTVPKDDFFVIGPGVQARRPRSPGHHFLTKRRKEIPFETVLVLRPWVHRVPLRPVGTPRP